MSEPKPVNPELVQIKLVVVADLAADTSHRLLKACSTNKLAELRTFAAAALLGAAARAFDVAMKRRK